VRNSCLESTYAAAQGHGDAFAVAAAEAVVVVVAAELAPTFPTKLHHPLEAVEEQQRNLRLILGPEMESRWTLRLLLEEEEVADAAPAASDEHAAWHAGDAPFQDNDQHSASLDTDQDSS
jgi:hypothetical protein